MKAKLPWILLAISLAFNALFTVGYFQARKQMEEARTFRGRTEAFARELGLDAEQYEIFSQLRDQFEQLRLQIAPQQEAFLDELIKENPDQKVLEDFCVGDFRNQLRLERLALMQKFVKMLRPDQRQMFVQKVKKRFGSSK